jgi:hypothetical protein
VLRLLSSGPSNSIILFHFGLTMVASDGRYIANGEKDVGLVGLDDHKFQVDDGQSTSKEIESFRSLVRTVCKEFRAQAVAEEFCEERVKQRNSEKSVCLQEACSLNLHHRYCDPDTLKREQLGIRDRADVQHELQLERREQNPPKEKLHAAYRKEDEKRERCWLEELRSLDVWPVVFVCGASHVEWFRQLLENEGLSCEVIVSRWRPSV